MNFESNGTETESVDYFHPEDVKYGTSRLESVSEKVEEFEDEQRFMAQSMEIKAVAGEEVEIDCDTIGTVDLEAASIDADDIVQELEDDNEEGDDSVNFVEENTLMVGY